MVGTPDMFEEATDVLRVISIVDERLVATLGALPGDATLQLKPPSRCAFRLPLGPKRYNFAMRYTLEHEPAASARILSLVDAAFHEAGLEPTLGADGQPIVGRAATADGRITYNASRPSSRDERSTTVVIGVVSGCMRLPRGYDNVVRLQDDWEQRLGHTSGPFSHS